MNADERWKGLEQKAIEAISQNANRRIAVSWLQEGLEGDPPIIPLGVIEIIAEEAFKLLPAIILWNWDKQILTPGDLRRKH